VSDCTNESGRSPSNRKGSASPSEGPGVVGLDRLSLSFRCSDLDLRSDQWDRVVMEQRPTGPGEVESVRTLSRSVVVGGARLFVSAREVPEAQAGRWWGKVEGNPSRIVDPEGVGLAPVEALPEVLSVMSLAAEAGRLVPAEPVPAWRVKRLDVARDFSEVDDPGRLIRGLAPIHRPHSRRNLIHADPQRNRAQTILIGSGAGVVRLYDKHTESSGAAPEGMVRWEAECRKAWCKQYADVATVQDMDNESVTRLALDRWEWSAMGVEVASSVGRLVQATARSGLSERERVFFVGWLMCEAGGQPVRGLGTATLAKYRRMQRTLGIAAPMELAGSVEVLSRLDWDSGREVLRVA